MKIQIALPEHIREETREVQAIIMLDEATEIYSIEGFDNSRPLEFLTVSEVYAFLLGAKHGQRRGKAHIRNEILEVLNP